MLVILTVKAAIVITALFVFFIGQFF